jgi:hypothetical protein
LARAGPYGKVAPCRAGTARSMPPFLLAITETLKALSTVALLLLEN